MTSQPKKSSGAGSTIMAWVFIATVVAVALTAINWGQAWMPVKGSKVSWNPIELIKYATAGQFHWSVGSTILLVVLLLGLMVVLTFGYSFLIAPLLSRGKDAKTPAGRSILSMMGFKPAVRKARQALTVPEGTEDADMVVKVAYNGKTALWAQWEDAGWCYAPQRGGKTLFVVVPAILEAIGPVLTTSTKVDVLDWTVIARREKGAVSVFDLDQISGWPDQARWNPIHGCQDQLEALDRGRAWAAAAPMEGTKNGSWFTKQAGAVLGRLLHAAALDHKEMTDVIGWIVDDSDTEPIQILERAGYNEVFIGLLTERASSGARETQDSIKATLMDLVEPLVADRVLAQFRFPASQAFDVEDFLRGNNTLYVIADGADSRLAPLVSMFTDHVFRAAKRLSQQKAGGRLWPPFEMLLDEAPNVAALPDMASVLTDSGGRGIRVMGFSQSFAQVEARWGQDVAETIRETANLKLLMPGLDVKHLKSFAEEMGVEDRERISYSKSRSGGSRTVSTEERAIMRANELKQLNVGQALLVYRNMPPTVVRLQPVFERKDAAALREQYKEAQTIAGRKSVLR